MYIPKTDISVKTCDYQTGQSKQCLYGPPCHLLTGEASTPSQCQLFQITKSLSKQTMNSSSATQSAGYCR